MGFLKRFFSLAVLLCLSSAVYAAPYIDPVLRPFLAASHTEDTRIIRVIIKFQDRMRLPNLPHNGGSHRAMEIAMMQNAEMSQQHVMGMLRSMAEARVPTRALQLWLFNSAIVDMPVNQLNTFAHLDELISITANKKVHLIHDFNGRRVNPRMLGEGAYTYGLEKIQIPELLSKSPRSNGVGVKVGILDTGIDANHKDLQGRLLLFKDFIGGKTQAYDDQGHGTHVSGTISGGNASGTQIGIAPGVKIIMGKVFDSSGSGDMDTLIQAMQWIADPDGNPNTNDFPSLVSNSWGGGAPASDEDPAQNNFCQASDSWVKLGMLPVFAAGNDGPDQGTVDIPGACPSALAVAATDSSDQVADFSSRGPAVWKSGQLQKPVVSAPGVKVLSSLPGNQYAEWDGTSMATPHVSGLAALLFQAQPAATVEQVVNVIIHGADPLGPKIPNFDYGYGRINAFKAFSQ